MHETALTQYIVDTFSGIDLLTALDDYYFYYDPDRILPHDRRMPFATLMTSDRYDQASHLDRPNVFRLNIGVSKKTYLSLFGQRPSPPGPSGIIETRHNFTTLDQLMPHPVYGHLFWVCVLNPDSTFPTVQSLLSEAHSIAAEKYSKRARM